MVLMGYDDPLFSIVIPTYERPQRLAECLAALTRLDYPRGRFEVIVVDDGSRVPPEDVVSSFGERFSVTLVRQSHAGPAAARNTGAARARGRVLAFTDDDCGPAADWLRTLEARFADTPNCAVGGPTINQLPDNPYARASQRLINYLYAYYNQSANHMAFFTSNNLAVPADQFRALEGFDPSFPLAAGEDRDFCGRWLHRGHELIYAPEVLVYHAHNLTCGSFLEQHFRYGRGAFYFHLKRMGRDATRPRLEPLSFYLNMLRDPWSDTQGTRAVGLTLLLLLSQVANASGYFWEKLHQLGRATSSP